MNTKPKIAFFGTPDLAADILESMIAAGFGVSLVVTAPDSPKGRGMSMSPSPVKAKAMAHGIAVMTPEKIDAHFLENFKNHGCDIGIVVAYGKILPQALIDMPRLGMWNIHYSLLPRFRGATPVESAILADDKETGVSLQKMVFALDAGDVAASEKVSIREGETAPQLRLRLNDVAKKILTETIPHIADNTVQLVPQTGTPTICRKIKKEDGLIDPRDTSRQMYLKYLAYSAWPRLYFFASSKTDREKKIRVIISRAVFQNGFVIEKVIPEGKKEIVFPVFQANFNY